MSAHKFLQNRWTNRVAAGFRKYRMLQLDCLASQSVRVLDPPGIYLPFTSSALNFHSLATVLNDININGRGHLVEFGSGVSTIYIARNAKRRKRDFRLTSVESDEAWIAILRDVLEEEDCQSCVQFVYAPLSPCASALSGLNWYNEPTVRDALKSAPPIDSVLVDGPMAHERKNSLSRYPAIPVIQEYLAKNNVVFLDDVHRQGEFHISMRWARNHGFTFSKVNPQFSMAFNGKGFNPIA